MRREEECQAIKKDGTSQRLSERNEIVLKISNKGRKEKHRLWVMKKKEKHRKGERMNKK